MPRPSWCDLPLEMRIMVMMHAPDLTSLYSLLLIDPSLLHSYERFFTHFFPRLLHQFPHLEPLVIDHLLIQQAGKISCDNMISLHLCNLAPEATWHLAEFTAHPLTILKDAVWTQKRVEYFTSTFIATRCRPPNDGITFSLSAKEPPLSTREEARLHRAFWLFQICCDLSQAWVSSDNMNKALRGPDNKKSLLISYLCKLMPWMLQELECVYDHLAELLDRNTQDPRLDAEGRPRNPFSLPEPIDTIPKAQKAKDVHVAKAKLLSQGLGFLYTYIRKASESDRAKETERLLKFPDEFLINTLRKIWSTGKFLKTDHSHRRRSIDGNVGPGCPNAGWAYFLPFCVDEEPLREWKYSRLFYPWSDENVVGLAFDQTKHHFLRYLRQFGFCIWDSDRLKRWGVLSHKTFGTDLQTKLDRIWCGWLESDSLICCMRRKRGVVGCRCRVRADPRLLHETTWRRILRDTDHHHPNSDGSSP